MSKKYDLVLVMSFFRPVAYFLPLIKYLAPDYRIAVYHLSDELRGNRGKNDDGQSLFVDVCHQLGADIIMGKTVNCSNALISQWPYTLEALNAIKNDVIAERFIGAYSLAWPGMHDKFIDKFKIDILLIIDKKFVNYLLEHKSRNQKYYKSVKRVIEVGLPFKKYPVNNIVQGDYFLAIPTAFSFPSETDKWFFLETVLALFDKLDKSDTVLFKPHNGLRSDGFSSERYARYIRWFSWMPGFIAMTRIVAKFTCGNLSRVFARFYTAVLYERVLARTIDLRKLTPWHYFAIEIFYPGIRKGIIGGLSNTQWGALFYRLPFYNCVDVNQQDRYSDDVFYGKGKKQPDALLELNIRYFGQPYCKGLLNFDDKGYGIINDSTRNGDLIAEVRSLLSEIIDATTQDTNSRCQTEAVSR